MRRRFASGLLAGILTLLSISPDHLEVSAQPAIVAPTYVSTSYDYTIAWESPWYVMDAESTADLDAVSLTDGLSQVSFIGITDDASTATSLLDEWEDAHTSEAGYIGYENMVDSNGNPMSGTTADGVFSFHTYSVLDRLNELQKIASFVEVTMRAEDVILVIYAEVEMASFSGYQDTWRTFADWVGPADATTADDEGGISGYLAGNDVEFLFDPGVSTQDQDTIAEGVGLAEDFLSDALGAELEQGLYVTAMPLEHRLNPGVAGASTGTSLAFYTGSPSWTGNLTPLQMIGVVVHEYVHAYQYSSSNGRHTYSSAAWFEEGIAEYLSVLAISGLGITDQAEFDELQRFLLASGQGVGLDLARLESRLAMNAAGAEAYPLSYLAIAHLLALTGADVTAINTYYSQLATGQSFETAFQAAFGIQSAESYGSFELARGQWGWVSSLSDDFVVREGQHHPTTVALVTVPPLFVTDHQFLITAQTAPGTICRLRIVLDGGEAALVNRSTFANGEGELFWLVTIPRDLDPSTGTLSASCGSIRDRQDIIIPR
jgi:hypothetical protein